MKSPFEEVWLHSPQGQALGALINGNQGWLMFLRHQGDSGLSSRNPSYAGDPLAEIQYVLGNGQVDHYPASWALPTAEVRRALEYFAKERRLPPFISWSED